MITLAAAFLAAASIPGVAWGQNAPAAADAPQAAAEAAPAAAPVTTPAAAPVTTPAAAPAAAQGVTPRAWSQSGGSEEPERIDRPSGAAYATKVEGERRQAFWGYEPGRPYEEVDTYTLPVVPIRLSGYIWADVGYMQQKNTQVGTFDKDINYAQGRFVLGASYRRDVGNFFAEARVQLVGFENEFTKSQYEPHTQDAFIRLGGRLWDVQVGRFLAWEPYYRGNGIDRYTAEENGALGGPAMYRLDYALGYEDEPGQAALHLYPADWLAFELASVYGQQSSQNKLGIRPVLALRRFGFLLTGGWEYVQLRPQDTSNKVEQTANGYAGRLQYTLLGTTVGVDAAKVKVDATQIDGLVNAATSFDKTTVGAFLESYFWNDTPEPSKAPGQGLVEKKCVLGAGYHLTTQDNKKGETNKHHQLFASLGYRLIPGLWLSGIYGYARADIEDVDAKSTWENDMTSFRVRLRYDFR